MGSAGIPVRDSRELKKNNTVACWEFCKYHERVRVFWQKHLRRQKTPEWTVVFVDAKPGTTTRHYVETLKREGAIGSVVSLQRTTGTPREPWEQTFFDEFMRGQMGRFGHPQCLFVMPLGVDDATMDYNAGDHIAFVEMDKEARVEPIIAAITNPTDLIERRWEM
jgi:hypothetical protein